MPGVDIETVTLDEDIDHPLDAVLAQVDRSKGGPVMIVGLERSIPSDAAEHPVLDALNLSRPDWAKELPRPLVFWVPDYLLGLMGRGAPDFLDWRSDTLFFPDYPGEDLLLLESNVWFGGMYQQVPGARRRSRIEELRARLALASNSDDPAILAVRADWLAELGFHQMLLNEWAVSLEAYMESLEIERRLGRRKKIADILGSIAILDSNLGAVERAEEKFRESLAIQGELGDGRGQITTLANLAILKFRTNQSQAAEEFCRKSLELAKFLEAHDLLPTLYNLLANIKLNLGELSAARELAEKVLSMSPQEGSGLRRSDFLHTLVRLSLLVGDWARAEQLSEELVEISRRIGDRMSLAEDLFNLGLLLFQKNRLSEAEKALQEARYVFDQLGQREGRERADGLLHQLSLLPSEGPQ